MPNWFKHDREAQYHAAAMVVAAAAAGWLLWAIGRVAPALAHAQVATSIASGLEGEVKDGLRLDFLFIVSYAVLAVAAFSPIRDPKRPGRVHPAAWAGIVLGVGGALADAVEDVLLWRAFDPHAPSWTLAAMRAAGLVKWGLLGAAALTLLTLLVRRSWRRPAIPLLPTTRPEPAPCPTWDPPRKGAKPKVGVCLSGGGIRSAAFCLGAMQALQEHEKLAEAKYVAAASGGGYLAAGWAVAAAGPPGDPYPNPTTPRRWSPGSPEERWFRDHSSYLVPDFKGGVAGMARLVGGVLVNILLIGLVLFAAARPVGWIIYEVHPTLRAKADTVLVRDSRADMEIGSVLRRGVVDNGDDPPAVRYEVVLARVTEDEDDWAAPPPNNACFDTEPYKPKARDLCVGAAQDDAHVGIVDVQGGKAKVVAQPKVKITAPAAPEVEGRRSDSFVAEQPKIGVKDDVVVDGEHLEAGQLEVVKQPKVGVKTGLWEVKYPKYHWWMWELVGGLFAGASLVGLVVMAARVRGSRGDVGRAAARALAGAGVLAFLVVIALPWIVVWLPRTATSLTHPTTKSSSGSGLQDYLLPGGGMLALLVTAATNYFAASKGKLLGGLWKQSKKLKPKLQWYDLSPSKVVVAVVSSVGLAAAYVNLLQFAAANGPKGRLMGIAFVRDFLPWGLFLPEWAKFGIVVAGLVVFALVADAHAWSLYPFYKTRLSSAFLLRRIDPQHAQPIPYDQLLSFTGLQKPKQGPQFIACCAVNLNEYGVVPPGRRAASFTFSSTEIGGPLVGYATPPEYEALPTGRKRDVTVASAMAISGAAFSPAMGKFNLGPVGGLLALANLRLGVWIPHPQRVRAGHPRWWWRFGRPNWVWFFRELTNKYGFDRRYVYVSDGGHWDNLGLVELLRRGCTEIYCISGAGDGAESFGTIGEAIALAREELGVEIDLDPSALRSPLGDPPPPPPPPPSLWGSLQSLLQWLGLLPAPPSPPRRVKRELRRQGAKDKAAKFAPASYVDGTFTFPDALAARGTLHYIEADLTADMPFDVHTFAESEPVFPDDSTGDQVFNHRQFESYRALGYHQTAAVLRGPLP